MTKNNAFSKYLHGAFYFNSAACTVQPAWFELAEAAHRDTLAPTSSFGPDGTASCSGGGVVGSESRNPTHAARNRRRDGGGSSVCALLCGCGDGREDAERGEGLRGHRGEEKDQEDQVSPLPWHLLGLDPLRRRRRRGKWTIAVRVDASPRTVSQPTNNPTNQPTNQPTINSLELSWLRPCMPSHLAALLLVLLSGCGCSVWYFSLYFAFHLRNQKMIKFQLRTTTTTNHHRRSTLPTNGHSSNGSTHRFSLDCSESA